MSEDQRRPRARRPPAPPRRRAARTRSLAAATCPLAAQRHGRPRSPPGSSGCRCRRPGPRRRRAWPRQPGGQRAEGDADGQALGDVVQGDGQHQQDAPLPGGVEPLGLPRSAGRGAGAAGACPPPRETAPPARKPTGGRHPGPHAGRSAISMAGAAGTRSWRRSSRRRRSRACRPGRWRLMDLKKKTGRRPAPSRAR